MKEIHAYLNDDGTYRVEAVGECYDGSGNKFNNIIKAARVKINMEVLAELSPDKTLYTIEIEDEKNENF